MWILFPGLVGMATSPGKVALVSNEFISDRLAVGLWTLMMVIMVAIAFAVQGLF